MEDILEKYPSLIEKGFQFIKRQKKTSVGVIDIFGKDKGGNYVVVELKVQRPRDRIIGQITRYMGYIKDEFDLNTNQVRGIIISKTITHKLILSAKFVRNLTILGFRVDERGGLAFQKFALTKLRPLEYKSYGKKHGYRDYFPKTADMLENTWFRPYLMPDGELVETD